MMCGIINLKILYTFPHPASPSLILSLALRHYSMIL